VAATPLLLDAAVVLVKAEVGEALFRRVRLPRGRDARRGVRPRPFPPGRRRRHGGIAGLAGPPARAP